MNEQDAVVIRRARPDDADDVASCVTRAYAHYVPRMGIVPAPALEDYTSVVVDREVWVAEVGPEIVAVLVLAGTPEGCLLDNVAVEPAWQGRGIGHRLLRLAERRAAQSGYDSIYLYVNVAMWENKQLYERLGFVEYERRTEGPYERIYLRKSLEGRPA
jgi:ribosomal protein S18 acetylase RimI-like enzyme